jgi:hypothetical protein
MGMTKVVEMTRKEKKRSGGGDDVGREKTWRRWRRGGWWR